MSGKRFVRRLWSRFEDQLLTDLAEKGLTAPQMEPLVGRCESSIRGRARKLGISLNQRTRHYVPLTGDVTTWDRAERLCAFANVPLPLARFVVEVADNSGLQVSELRSESRSGRMVKIRAHIAKEARRNGYSLETIGRALNRDHTTVIHAIRSSKLANTCGEISTKSARHDAANSRIAA